MKKRKRTKKYKKKSLKKKRKKILSKKKRKKISFKKKKRLKKRKRLRKNIRILKKKKNKHLKTKAVILSLLNVNDKIKSFFSFKFDLDRSLQNFFQGISDKISEIQKLIQEEKEKQKKN